MSDTVAQRFEPDPTITWMLIVTAKIGTNSILNKIPTATLE
jgi:hypothetical protein